MTEFCFPVTMKSKQFSGHIFSDFAVLCSFVISHPLYFSYLLFFSPYLLKVLAFLSPLFITTTLLFLSLLTSIFHDSTSFSSLLEDLRLRFDRIGGEEDEESKEMQWVEDFEVYKIVFEFPAFDLARDYPCGEIAPDGLASGYGSSVNCSEENPVELSGKFEGKSCVPCITDRVGEIPGEETEEKVLGVLICSKIRGDNPSEEENEEKILGVLISDDGDFPAKCRASSDDFSGKRQDGERLEELSAQETAECEKLTWGVGKAGEENPTVADTECIKEVLKIANQEALELTLCSFNGGNQTQQKALIKTHSRRHGQALWSTNDGNNSSKKHDDDYGSQAITPTLSNLGSMRKEREWRRTLACKLFEERHNVGGGGGGNGGDGSGGEGMDLLWEAYEKTEENRGKEGYIVKKKKEKHKKGRVVDYVVDYDDDEEEEEEEEGDNGQLCCLQALKFSAGKMNFGMGRPGFLKISKAFKGIGGGWLNHHLHHSGSSKKGKKL